MALREAWKIQTSGVMELGETILFSFCVGRQDYVNEVPKQGGELWGLPRSRDRHSWERFLPVLAYARFKIYKKNQVSQGFRAKKTWKLGIIQKECHSCFSSSASPTSVLTGILLCLQLCYQH